MIAVRYNTGKEWIVTMVHSDSLKTFLTVLFKLGYQISEVGE